MNSRGVQQARDIPYDDGTSSYSATDVQAALAAVKVLVDGKVGTIAYGQWRSTVSTQSLTTSVNTQLNLGVEDVDSGAFTINASNELQLDTALDFLYLSMTMNGVTSSGTRGSLRMFLKYSPLGAGYGSTLLDSRGYVRNATGSKQITLKDDFLFGSPAATDLFKIDGGITSGTGTTTTTAFGVRLIAIGLKI